LAALFAGRVFWPMSLGPCFVGKVLSEAALIGWVVFNALARPDFLRLIGVIPDFFENREKLARFLDLLLEPFLPIPI
jgi:hypothetical protein